MDQEQVGSSKLVKNWLLLVGTWVVAVALFQAGCGGGGKAAGQVSESPESSMTSEVAGSDSSSSAEASSTDSSSDEVAAVDSGSDGAAGGEEVAKAGEKPDADTLLATEGMETDKGGKKSATEASSEPSTSDSLSDEAESASLPIKNNGASSMDGDVSYSVVKGDCLWRIAGKSSIYQDPWEWPLLFHANEKVISNPDLIHTGWNLEVPRGVEDAKIVAAVQEARAAHYVPPSRAMRAVSTEPAAAVQPAAQPAAAAPAKPAVVTAAKPADAKPMAARKSGGFLKGILWIIILAVLGAAGYLYWKKMNSGKSLGMGTAAF